MNNFQLIEYALNGPSFYILGAGASAGIIPVTNQTGVKIIGEYHKNGIYDIKPNEISNAGRRILGNADFSDDLYKKELNKRIPDGFIKNCFYKLMTSELKTQPPEQYSVFELSKYRSVIFNFNVDGLANKYCNKHLVLNPHGMLNPNYFQTQSWNNQIENSLVYLLEALQIHDVILPGKEPKEITDKECYKIARQIYPYSKYVVLIGYSFGLSGSEIDDLESFNYFVDIFRQDNRPIIIINPFDAEYLAYLFGDILKRSNIYVISAYWNHLATALLKLMRLKLYCPHEKDRNRYSLYYIYQTTLDKTA